MYQLSLFCAAIFVLYPPLVLGYRFFRQKPNWLIICLSIALLGWACWKGYIYFHFEHLGAILDSQQNPSESLLDEWTKDGAQRVFAHYFGWAIATAYALPWYALFAVSRSLQAIRQRITNRQRQSGSG